MSALAVEPQPRANVDLDVQQFVIGAAKQVPGALRVHLENSITDGSIDRTTDGASTLTVTVHDPKTKLLQSGVFDSAVNVTLDRNAFRLVKVSKQGDALTLTFEDLIVALLRARTGPKKANRANVTRAEFALSLLREVSNAPFVCPQLHNKQPIVGSGGKARLAPEARASSGSVGADVVLGFGELEQLWLNAGGSADVQQTMAAIALAESSGRVNAVGGPNSNGTFDYGLWQINSVHGYNKTRLLSDPGYNAQCAVAIYNSQGLGAWSTYTSGAYKAHLQPGMSSVAAGTVNISSARRSLPYQFQRGSTNGKPENSWDCLTRLAKEVNWRCFVSDGSVYFISDDDLLTYAPRATLGLTSPGVIDIDFDIDNGKVQSEVQMQAHAARWQAGPGDVITLQDLGPANGAWLVHDVQRSLFDPNAQITLRRPVKALLEPAATTQAAAAGGSSSRTGSAIASLTTTGSSNVETAYAAAQAIAARHYPYVWGGGHGAAGTPSGGIAGGPGGGVGLTGFDCSGSVCAVLAAAGMGFRPGGPVDASGALMGWGEAGPGAAMTVYCNPVHTFIFFNLHGLQHFGTSNSNPGGGPGFAPLRSTSGFAARHWPGT